MGSVLREFFEQQPDGWHNSRVERELEKSKEISEKRSKAGKASGEKRAHSRPTCVPTCVEQVFPQPQPQPQILPPSTAAVGFPSEDRSLTNSHTRARVYSDEDFLARDLRKFRLAEEGMEEILKAQPSLTSDEIFEMICERAGLSITDALRAKEFQHKWPSAERASA